MQRPDAIRHAEKHFDSGEFRQTLARRIAVPTESQNPERAQALADYLDQEMRPAFEAMGFECRTLTHPKARAPFLFAERLEDATLPTVFGYGHGDVIRIREWVPRELPASVRRALADCEIDGGTDGPAVEPWWGEPGLSPAERVFGWCSFEVLAYKTGNPNTPVNAIPPTSLPRCWACAPYGYRTPTRAVRSMRRTSICHRSFCAKGSASWRVRAWFCPSCGSPPVVNQ